MIRFDVPADEYHRRVLGEISKSGIDQARRSLAHYRAWIAGERDLEQSAAMRMGTAVHMAVLEPARYAATYVVPPDFGDCRKTENKSARNEWRAVNAGRIELEASEAATIAGIQESLAKNADVRKHLRGTRTEVDVRWQDGETGLLCKARVDAWNEAERIAVDLKTTGDASREAFPKTCAAYGYHRQAALYRLGFAANDKPLKQFVFIAVEKEPPYAVNLFELSDDAIVRGYSQCRLAIDAIAGATKDNAWDAYEPGIHEIDLPPWA